MVAVVIVATLLTGCMFLQSSMSEPHFSGRERYVLVTHLDLAHTRKNMQCFYGLEIQHMSA